MEQDKKCVYIINNRPAVVIDRLKELGFQVLVGDGRLNDDMLAACWGFYPGRSVVDETVLDKAPNLKVICKQGVGVDRIDVDACTRRGICVANTPNSNFISVAEHTMALLLALEKRLYPISVHVRVNGEDPATVSKYTASELYGKTLSVIGLGKIGLRVAELAHAFGMEIVAYVRHPERVKAPEYISLTASMDDAIRQADYLSLHVSGTKENRNLIGKRELELMKPTAVLINTTRGFVVDEDALYQALVNHKIAGAALDVVRDDPIRAGNPLFELEQVMVTPHTAANTRESRVRADLECLKILTDYANGKRPDSALNQVTIG